MVLDDYRDKDGEPAESTAIPLLARSAVIMGQILPQVAPRAID